MTNETKLISLDGEGGYVCLLLQLQNCLIFGTEVISVLFTFSIIYRTWNSKNPQTKFVLTTVLCHNICKVFPHKTIPNQNQETNKKQKQNKKITHTHHNWKQQLH